MNHFSKLNAMCFSFNSFSPSHSKLYTIQYNNKSYKNIHNAIFGRASKPYRFNFFKTGEGEYFLTRYEDRKVLCIGKEGLEMHSSIKGKKLAKVKFIKVSKNTYALSVQNQETQKYITYNGYVMHEYYVGLEVSDSIIDLGIWTINEISQIHLSVPETPIANYDTLNAHAYLSGFTSKIPIESSLN